MKRFISILSLSVIVLGVALSFLPPSHEAMSQRDGSGCTISQQAYCAGVGIQGESPALSIGLNGGTIISYQTNSTERAQTIKSRYYTTCCLLFLSLERAKQAPVYVAPSTKHYIYELRHILC